MDLILLKPGIDLHAADSHDDPLITASTETANCIELLSSHFAMKQQITTDVSNSARTSGRPVLSDMTVVKYLDDISPLLYKHCLSALPIDDGITPTQIFICRNTEWDQEGDNILPKIMTIKLWDCLISSIEAQSHPDDMATEQLTLNFTRIEWATSEKDSKGMSSDNHTYSWSVAKNRGILS